MSKLNPLFETITEIDNKIVAEFVPKKLKKPHKALKITVVAAAAALLLGTAATAATFGDDPIVKINNKQVAARHSSYVNESGWTVETTFVELPFKRGSYSPVGEIRAVYDEFSGIGSYYDEFGIQMDNITSNSVVFFSADKSGETPVTGTHGKFGDNYHSSVTVSSDSSNINVELWQDPIQALQSATAKKMTIEEQIEMLSLYTSIIEYSGYGGFECPSVRELLETGGKGTFDSVNSVICFECAPSEAMRLYNYAPLQIDGFSEKAGATVVLYTNAVWNENDHEYTFSDDEEIVQQMFVYTLIEEESGNEIQFTVWRSEENKDTYTDHFDIEYEYIPLNNGTQACFHRSSDGFYLLEFEADGAAYGLRLNGGRGAADQILNKMDLL